MTRQETKAIMPIIQAYAEGKVIQYSPNRGNTWFDVAEDVNHDINTDEYEYRIKPTPKYRPFANAEECMTEILKHQPFLKYKCGSICRDVYLSIVKIKLDGIETDEGGYEFNDAMNRFTFADGDTFGAKVEEE